MASGSKMQFHTSSVRNLEPPLNGRENASLDTAIRISLTNTPTRLEVSTTLVDEDRPEQKGSCRARKAHVRQSFCKSFVMPKTENSSLEARNTYLCGEPDYYSMLTISHTVTYDALVTCSFYRARWPGLTRVYSYIIIFHAYISTHA